MRDYLRHSEQSEDARRRYSDAKRQPKDVDVLQYAAAQYWQLTLIRLGQVLDE